MALEKALAAVGMGVPRILLPRLGSDMTAWATVACDQYTSEPKYWEGVADLVGTKPSTLRLMLPEAFLGTADEEDRVKAIWQSMREYLQDGTFREVPQGMVLVRRDTARGPPRTGIVATLDLTCYGWQLGNTCLARASEATVPERLPPRAALRREAAVEMPHALVLYDDPSHTVTAGLEGGEILYDFNLMTSGGHVKGTMVNEEGMLHVAAALAALVGSGPDPMLFAVGDGNHSIAAAKQTWDELQASGSPPDHPARYCLVEFINLHDPGLLFEPIHRVLFGYTAHQLISDLIKTAQDNDGAVSVESVPTGEDALRAVETPGDAQIIGVVDANSAQILTVRRSRQTLAVATVQTCLNQLLEKGASVDYIHGADAVMRLGRESGNVGVLLPAMRKDGFFPTVLREGRLPRKAFSLGEPHEKRFYIECRRITP